MLSHADKKNVVTAMLFQGEKVLIAQRAEHDTLVDSWNFLEVKSKLERALKKVGF